MLPDVDHIDVQPRQENLHIRGQPVMLQLCVVPSYALTIHKTQVRCPHTLPTLDAHTPWQE